MVIIELNIFAYHSQETVLWSIATSRKTTTTTKNTTKQLLSDIIQCRKTVLFHITLTCFVSRLCGNQFSIQRQIPRSFEMTVVELYEHNSIWRSKNIAPLLYDLSPALKRELLCWSTYFHQLHQTLDKDITSLLWKNVLLPAWYNTRI